MIIIKNLTIERSLIISVKSKGNFNLSSLTEDSKIINQRLKEKSEVTENKIYNRKHKIKKMGPIL